jgi:hypothetical protein
MESFITYFVGLIVYRLQLATTVLFASCWACLFAPFSALHIQVYIIWHTITLSLAHFGLPMPSTTTTNIIKSICYSNPCHSQPACSDPAALQQGKYNAPAATETPCPDKLSRSNDSSPQKVKDTANSKLRDGPTLSDDGQALQDTAAGLPTNIANEFEQFCAQRLAFRQRMGIA